MDVVGTPQDTSVTEDDENAATDEPYASSTHTVAPGVTFTVTGRPGHWTVWTSDDAGELHFAARSEREKAHSAAVEAHDAIVDAQIRAAGLQEMARADRAAAAELAARHETTQRLWDALRANTVPAAARGGGRQERAPARTPRRPRARARARARRRRRPPRRRRTRRPSARGGRKATARRSRPAPGRSTPARPRRTSRRARAAGRAGALAARPRAPRRPSRPPRRRPHHGHRSGRGGGGHGGDDRGAGGCRRRPDRAGAHAHDAPAGRRRRRRRSRPRARSTAPTTTSPRRGGRRTRRSTPTTARPRAWPATSGRSATRCPASCAACWTPARPGACASSCAPAG